MTRSVSIGYLAFLAGKPVLVFVEHEVATIRTMLRRLLRSPFKHSHTGRKSGNRITGVRTGNRGTTGVTRH